MDFANPLLLLLISPVALAGWYAIRRGISKYLIISRVVILSLLIIALASPFTLGTTTIKDDLPRITVITDQTMSMDLFDKDTGNKVFEAMRTKTSATQRQFAGISSPIGDEVIQAADNNNLVLVSDGNNNYGKDLFDAISLVSRIGTRVFAVQQKPLHNDASVEIESPKNLIIGNENVFNIVVRQAGEETAYRLDVEIDGSIVKREAFVQTERTKVISVNITFNTLGTHKVIATITPDSEDRFALNNEFYKAVFVVPKPKVLFIGDESSSLYKIVSNLYNVKTTTSFQTDLSEFKAIILDNIGVSSVSDVDSIRNFTSSGGGLVVVGGDNSYDYPPESSYNNSEFEMILPVISKAAEYKGGMDIVLVVDVSGSTVAPKKVTVENEIIGTAFGEIIPNIITFSKDLKPDAKLGIVVFNETSSIALPMTSLTVQNKKLIEENLMNYSLIKPGTLNDFASDLSGALLVASDMLSKDAIQKQIIVISDGEIKGADESDAHFNAAYTKAVQTATELSGKGVSLTYVRVLGEDIELGSQIKFKELAEKTGEYRNIVTGERLKPSKEVSESPAPTPTPEVIQQFPLIVVDSDHFITKYINLSTDITGYNDVTHKLGSQILVTTSRGKPILTAWGFGLGRVASFTTDNGAGETRWASAVYSGENSRLISSMINWAIGDPRPKGDVVVQAEDIWAGTPGKVVITSSTLPAVKLDKSNEPLDLSRTGPSTYETSISPEETGFHDLSGYGIAVNYPLEYREMGFNEKFKSVIESNGGRVYNEDEIEGLMLLDIKEKSVRTVEEPKSEKEPFLLAALVLFLVEVIIRRMKDYRKDRPQIEDNPPRAAPAVEVGAAE